MSLDYLAGAPGQKIRESSEVRTPPELLFQKEVEVPKDFPAKSVKATFIVRMLIDIHGRVVQARILGETHHQLQAQVLKAAYQYEFKPAELDGKAVAVWFQLSIQVPLKTQSKPQDAPPN